MKILVADRISETGVDFLKSQEGFEVIEAYGSTKEQILEIVPDVKAIVVRSETKVDRDVLEAAKDLVAVGRAGVGVDNIDIPAATEIGVVVMNTPGGNTIATAELTFTHMLCGARPVAQACATMRDGRWDRKLFTGTELRQKKLAVLGLGRIGSEVAKRAKAFEMKVLAYDPYLSESRAEALGVEIVDLDRAFEEADYISVHMPLTDSTRGMVDADAISRMKDGVRIFNCARGGIVDEAALAEGLQSGKVAAAGLDVTGLRKLCGSAQQAHWVDAMVIQEVVIFCSKQGVDEGRWNLLVTDRETAHFAELCNQSIICAIYPQRSLQFDVSKGLDVRQRGAQIERDAAEHHGWSAY